MVGVVGVRAGVVGGGGGALEASLCSLDEWWDSDGGGRCPCTIVKVRVVLPLACPLPRQPRSRVSSGFKHLPGSGSRAAAAEPCLSSENPERA